MDAGGGTHALRGTSEAEGIAAVWPRSAWTSEETRPIWRPYQCFHLFISPCLVSQDSIPFLDHGVYLNYQRTSWVFLKHSRYEGGHQLGRLMRKRLHSLTHVYFVTLLQVLTCACAGACVHIDWHQVTALGVTLRNEVHLLWDSISCWPWAC